MDAKVRVNLNRVGCILLLYKHNADKHYVCVFALEFNSEAFPRFFAGGGGAPPLLATSVVLGWGGFIMPGLPYGHGSTRVPHLPVVFLPFALAGLLRICQS